MILTPLLSLLAPHDCLGCDAEGSLLCEACRSGLRTAIRRCYRCHNSGTRWATCLECTPVSPLYAVHAAVRYESLAKDLIWKLKFGRAKAAASEIAQLMALSLSRQDLRRVIVTHAPTATTRVRQRGYDQAALIARAFAARTGAVYVPLLARQNRSKQIGASRSERARQLRGAFRPVRTRYIKGATILVIDDVVTTGATLEAAAAALMDAGAKRVVAAVFAQA